MYPSFSDTEFARRHREVRERMDDLGLHCLLVYGAGSSTPIHYLSNWLTTVEAYLLFPATEDPTLFVQLSNHVETATDMAIVDDVRFGGRRDNGLPSTIASLTREISARGFDRHKIGVVGRLPWQHYLELHREFPHIDLYDFSSSMNRQLQIKSSEEVARIRASAAMSDGAIDALQQSLRPGMTEYEIGRVIEDSYLASGGVNGIHFILTTSMISPDVCTPRQYLTSRRLAAGDVVVVEISTKLFGYSGQVLRTFTVAAEPTPLYSELQDVAQEVYERTSAMLRPGATVGDVLEVTDFIGECGFTIGDDFLHGANQLPPIVRTKESGAMGDLDFTFREGMCVVVQPNVIVRDRSAGVQYGEMLHIGTRGAERLHSAETGLLACS